MVEQQESLEVDHNWLSRNHRYFGGGGEIPPFAGFKLQIVLGGEVSPVNRYSDGLMGLNY